MNPSDPLSLVWWDEGIEVWLADLDTTPCGPLAAILDAGERAEAERFSNPKLRARFLVRRGLARIALGRAVGTRPEELVIVRPPGGKPYLAEREALFSTASSEGTALIAVSRHTEVGVDLEAVRSPLPPQMLDMGHLSAGERSSLARLPRDRQAHEFAALWARKEAYAKALGLGLALPLSEWEVLGSCPLRVGPLRVEEIDAGPRLAAALAVREPEAGTPKAV